MAGNGVNQTVRRLDEPDAYSTTEAVWHGTRDWALSLTAAQRLISSTLDLRTILMYTARECRALTHSKAVFVTLRDEGRLVIREACTEAGRLKMDRPWVLSDRSLASRAMKKCQPVRWARAYHGAEGAGRDLSDHVSSRWPNVAVPLLTQAGPIGAITFTYDGATAFGPREELIAELLAVTAVTAIENARSHASSVEIAQRLTQELIAQDLHDSVAQSICVIRVKIDNALAMPDLPPGNKAVLNDVRRVVIDAATELRNAVFALPEVHTLQSSELMEALTSEVKAHMEQDGCPVSFFSPPVVPDIPSDICETARRVVHEGLNNVRKHSHASRAIVGLVVDASCVKVFVQDDGTGIRQDESAAAGSRGLHFGLENLKRLVEGAGGTLLVQNGEDEEGLMLRAKFAFEKDGLT